MLPKIKVDVGRGLDPVELQQVIDTDLQTRNKTVVGAINELSDTVESLELTGVLEGVAGVEGSVANKTFTVTGVSTDLLKQGSEVLVFDCGTSAV